MKKIGSYEAKTHLSSLLDQVANGERFAITKHGVPIAHLVPVPGSSRVDTQKVISDILKFRSEKELKSESVLDWITEGRKY